MGVIPYEKQMKLIREEEERHAYLLEMEKGFQVADVFVNRQYLDNFSRAQIIPMSRRELCAPQKLRIFQMTKVVLDKDEDVLDKLASVYNALYNLSVTVAVIIAGNPKDVKFYFATRAEQIAPLAGRILESTLRANFPGIDLRAMNSRETETFLDAIEKTSEGRTMLKGLATVSVVPAIRDKEKKEQFVQGMEKLINTLRGKNYTAVLLATPLSEEDIINRRHGYEELYFTLSPHSKFTYAYGENVSHAVNKGVSSSFTKSVNQSVSNSNSTSSGTTETTSSGRSSGSNFGGGASGDGSSFNWGSNSGTSSSTSTSYNSSTSFSNSISNSVGTSEAESLSSGETDTVGASETRTLNFENKGVSDLLKRIEQQLERINAWESYGLWESCAYFSLMRLPCLYWRRLPIRH